MKMRIALPIMCLLLSLSLSLSAESFAQGMGYGGMRESLVRQSERSSEVGGQVPLNQVVAMVQQRFNATAVKTDTVMEDGQLVYRIRLLSADRSRVFTVSVDARTGRVY